MTEGLSPAQRVHLPAGDYVSPGLSVVLPDACFPEMIVGDKASHPWPYLRREVDHNWYCDRRSPLIGFLNRDEAVLLHNLALQFRGKPGIEIGCWMGWSTCHLALAGMELDVVDPALSNPDIRASVQSSLDAAGVLSQVRLHPAFSPGGVKELAALNGVKWNFFFIDGDHGGSAPELDVRECLEHAAPDALFVFHDLTSPDVANGLHLLWGQGWDVLVYQTMQVMGVAWRGRARPVDHTPDRSIAWSLPAHLAPYPVSGSPANEELRRLSMAMAASDAAMTRLQEDLESAKANLAQTRSEKALCEIEIGCHEAALASQASELSELERQTEMQDAELARRRDLLADRDATVAAMQGELMTIGSRVQSQDTEVHDLRAGLINAQTDLARQAGDLAARGSELLAHQAEAARLHSEVAIRDREVERLALAAARNSSELERLRRSVADLYGSTLWKASRPLRIVKRLAAAGWDKRRQLASLRFFLSAHADSETVALIAGSGLFDVDFYVAQNSTVRQIGMDPIRHYLACGAAQGLDPHPLFDTSFYAESYPDVAQGGVNPLTHYLLHGALEGRDPHPLFDTSYYCDANADVRQDGVNPLAHYVLYGAAEGRDPRPLPVIAEHLCPTETDALLDRSGLFDSAFYVSQSHAIEDSGLDPIRHYIVYGATESLDPHPLFSTAFYRNANPDVASAGTNPLAHFLLSGAAEGRDPHPLFDTSFYQESSPPGTDAGTNPLAHYLLAGAAEGRDPHPLFDTSFYQESNPDVGAAGLNPLVHYLRWGAAEGCDPHPLFDTSFYQESYPDVVAAGVNPLVHYLSTGASEGRDPHPWFDTSFHCEANPDVVQAGLNPLAHYVQYGAVESRDPHPLFDSSFYLEQKPHLKALGINPLVHFLAAGPTVEFDPLPSTTALANTGICIVTPDIVGPVKNGGIGTASFHFARVLAEAGHTVSVVFTSDLTECQRAHWRNVYARMGISFIALSDLPPVTRLVYGSTWFFERSWRVFEYLRGARFSVVHFQDWHANGFWSIKAKRVGLAFEKTTFTVMMHSCTKWINEGMQQFGAEPIETAKLVWAETYCMEHCDYLLSPSRYMLEWAAANHVRTPPQSRLTPYVWADRNAADAGGAAAAEPRPADNDHLIFFGRLETRKGLHIFADALRRLQRAGGGALPRTISFLGKHGTVQGRTSADFLEELRRELPIGDIRIINHLDYTQAMAYIRQTSGLVVMPSILDNYPLTVIECVQSGIPFIAAASGGIPEMVDPGVIFDPNPISLAERLSSRGTIDHRQVVHKYVADTAASVWLDLHAALLSGDTAGGTLAPARSHTPPPRVSVCIPFFNHQRYLHRLVDAFARQRYGAFEVVLVNDGSSEEASREFDRVAGRCRDRRFHFHTTINQGPGAARNGAVDYSSGELLMFFDTDNLPKGTDFISTMVRALQRSNADCVTSPYNIVSADRLAVSERDVVATYRPIGPCIEAGFFENVFGDTTLIITRDAFTGVGGFPIHREVSSAEGDGVRLSGQQRTWEDHEFLLNLCFKGATLETFPEAMFFYRQDPRDGNHRANDFLNYQSLFAQLQRAPSENLARIISAVGGPMLVARSGQATANLVAH